MIVSLPTDLMAAGDAAHILGVSRALVVRLIAAGILPGKVGGKMARTSYAAVLALKGQWQEEVATRDEDSYQ